MRVLILLFLVLALEAPFSYGQRRTRSQVQSGDRRERREVSSAVITPVQDNDFKQTAQGIKAARPIVTNETLNCDEQIILAAFPEIKETYKERGFSEQEATDATLTSWKEVRLHSPLESNKCMVLTSFKAYVTFLGKLVFRTTPDEANIEMNDSDLNQKTRYSKWYEPKTYKVKYTKDGYEPAEKQCTVSKGKETDCHAELQKKP